MWFQTCNLWSLLIVVYQRLECFPTAPGETSTMSNLQSKRLHHRQAIIYGLLLKLVFLVDNLLLYKGTLVHATVNQFQ